jgi:branched-chain amino acid transport system permease protein
MTITEYILQQVINALSLGSLYALVALGLSLIFGILRLTNFAHGDVMMLGAFTAALLSAAGLPLTVGLPAGIVVAGAAGLLIERVAYRPLRGAPDVTLLLTSLAVTYVIENLAILVFSASPRNFPIPAWLDLSWDFADGRITVTAITVLTIGLTLVSLIGLGWFVSKTTAGLGMRALAEDSTAAQLIGLNVNKLIAGAFALASSYAGLAGVLWASQAGVVDAQMGFSPLLKAFVASIIGGLGSTTGALLGGFLLGILEVFIVAFLPPEVSPYRDALVFSLLILFLLVRPAGLLKPNREIKL